MKIELYDKLKLKVISRITLAGVGLGLLFILLTRGFSQPFALLNGAIAGAFIGFSVGVLEIYIFPRNAKRLKFIWYFLIRSITYTVFLGFILFNVTLVSQMFRFDETYFEVLRSDRFIDYLEFGSFGTELIYIMLLALTVNFTRLMSIKLGQGVLQDYVLGTYHRPVIEKKVFLFAKISNSEELTKKLGALRYHSFLDRLYRDITAPVLRNHGIIHQYIEDLIVITWNGKIDNNANRCIKLYKELEALIESKKEGYQKKYGFVPKFVAGAHCGTVITAEIGEIKTQIVYQGDTMNTSSRILNKAIELKSSFLISDELYSFLIGNNLDVMPHRNVHLKGKEMPMDLIAINT